MPRANVACEWQGGGRAPPREPGLRLRRGLARPPRRRREPAGTLGGAQSRSGRTRMLAGRGAGPGLPHGAGICGEELEPQVCAQPGPLPGRGFNCGRRGRGGPPWKRPTRLVGALRVRSQARGRPGGGPRVGESRVSLLSARALSGRAAILSPLRLSSGGSEKHRLEVWLRACLYPLGLRRTLVFGVGVLKCLARNGKENAWELGTPLFIGFHRFKF